VPIWKQIEDGVRLLVASGALAPETAVPSVRELSRQLRVNPATVSKAYQRLTTAGILEVRRGEGTFVSQTPPALPEEERRERLERAALAYVSLASTLAFSPEEINEGVRIAIEALGTSADRKSEK
jgi:GntR family transcriptional regulator